MKDRSKVRIIAACVCGCVAVVCALLLAQYGLDYIRARQISAVLAAQYHAEATAAPTAALSAEELPAAQTQQAAVVTAMPNAAPTQQAATAAPQATYDPFGGYPDNPQRIVSQSFRTLHKTNPDICGWITIGTELDQAVVQRDNEYYLTRDYTGSRNANGAIFLDEQVKLYRRPVCYILYGHNMKTGAMFGMLHKYTEKAYLRDHPVITFNTEYEEGEFAIFAAGKVVLDPGDLLFVDYYSLPGSSEVERARIIGRLKQVSDFSIPLEVGPDDQLLILVTCVGDDRERRLVAARRLRPGETEQSLHMTYLLAEDR